MTMAPFTKEEFIQLALACEIASRLASLHEVDDLAKRCHQFAAQVTELDGSNLVRHAAAELRRAGMFDEDSSYGGMLGHAVMRLVRTHAAEGHSGFSHGIAMSLFRRVGDFKVLSPLTDNPEEWNEVDPADTRMWQSARQPSCFSTDGGKTYYDVTGKDRTPRTAAEHAALAADKGNISDGYHTFNEIYDHRITLFIALCYQFDADTECEPMFEVWRSKLHSDSSALEGWFVMGINTRAGEQITYHIPLERWDETNFVNERERAPEFDGHTSADVIARLKQLYR